MSEGWGPPQNQPQQGWGGQQQNQPQQPAVQPPPANEFFQGGGGASGPSFKFEFDAQNNRGTGVIGTIVSQQQVPKTQPNSTVQQADRSGRPLWQLRVTLQTTLRGWAGVAVVPTVENSSGQTVAVPPDQDTGLRNVYIWYTMREAVEAAFAASGASPSDGLRNGAELGIKVTGTRTNPNGGFPIKEYAAVYRPNGPSGQAAAQPPAQQAPPPPPQQQWTPPPAQQQAPPPQGPPPGYSDEPPF